VLPEYHPLTYDDATGCRARQLLVPGFVAVLESERRSLAMNTSIWTVAAEKGAT